MEILTLGSVWQVDPTYEPKPHEIDVPPIFREQKQAGDNRIPDQKDLKLSTKFFYHYTTGKNAKSIQQSKILVASTDTHGDCVYGKGIYFTTATPTNSKS